MPDFRLLSRSAHAAGLVISRQTFVRRCQSRTVSQGACLGLAGAAAGPPLAGFSNMKKPPAGYGRLFSNRPRRQQSLRRPCAHCMSFCAGTLGNCLKYGLSCSLWQREPSGPQSRSTCSRDLHLPSQPRNPGPPLVPQVALAIDGSARTMAAAATNSFVIFFFSLVRKCTVTRHCESGATASLSLCPRPGLVALRQIFVRRCQT
jgi:hypothetical protein